MGPVAADIAARAIGDGQGFADGIQELTPLILNKLIDRIEVGNQEVVDGQRQQEFTVAWRFVGEV